MAVLGKVVISCSSRGYVQVLPTDLGNRVSVEVVCTAVPAHLFQGEEPATFSWPLTNCPSQFHTHPSCCSRSWRTV